ncbi:NAC domain-containing protein 55 [Eutrema salsugineum]|uniref:NAC domain-containing protein 55 n=1 Tax=Eutrema salsugineum TaxID=72664 RepID=UPI000CED587D|nr:NAC domain-containing protein 55 [Eutrema salsugineum]
MAYYYESDDEELHFEPEDDELINGHLIPMSKGKYAYGDYIVMKNVYAKEPWLLDHTKDTFFNEDEWYYFVTRTQVSEKNIDCRKKAKRKSRGQRLLELERKSNNNKKKQKTEDGAASCAIVSGSNSRWTMTEYRLKELKEDKNFQKLVLCKIREIKNKKSHHKCFSNLSQQPINTGHKSILASSSLHQQKQLINEAHRLDPYIGA